MESTYGSDETIDMGADIRIYDLDGLAKRHDITIFHGCDLESLHCHCRSVSQNESNASTRVRRVNGEKRLPKQQGASVKRKK